MKTILLLLCSAPLLAGSGTSLTNLEDKARAYLRTQGGFAAHAELDFTLIDVVDDELGQTHLRYQPLLNGLPVYGEHLIVHSWSESQALIGTSGELRVPSATAELKRTAEVETVLADHLPDDAELLSEPTRAYVVDERHVPQLATMVEVGYEDEAGPQRDVLFFDVGTGQLIARHPQHRMARDRQTYNLGGATSGGVLARVEGSPNSGEAAVDNAHNFAGKVYDYYANTFGRDSLDNNGMALVSRVHYSHNFNGAFWNGSEVFYGDGDGTRFSNFAGALDVVAHEFNHGVTKHSAGFVYANESGALDEATADIMAAAIEAANGGSFTDIWYLGEDIYTPAKAGDAVRYLNNPTRDGSSRDFYPERYTGTGDLGGVHLNSGIPNLMFYLLSNGGRHPRNKTFHTVIGIGIPQATRIWYRALTVYMTPSSNFASARMATLRAAADLHGYGSGAYQSVCSAWLAVGVGDPSCTAVP